MISFEKLACIWLIVGAVATILSIAWEIRYGVGIKRTFLGYIALIIFGIASGFMGLGIALAAWLEELA